MLLTWGRPQHVGVEMFIGGQIGGLDAQQVFDLTGDIVAFAHLGAAGNGFFETFLRRLAVLRKGHVPECGFKT